jgi:hypothetical protein
MHSSEFYPDNYTTYRRDRGTDDHGGVVIATMNNLTTEVPNSKSVELISVKIDLQSISGRLKSPPTQKIALSYLVFSSNISLM